jgi:hypothetical protein
VYEPKKKGDGECHLSSFFFISCLTVASLKGEKKRQLLTIFVTSPGAILPY